MRLSIAIKKDIISIYSHELGIKTVEKIRDKELLGKRYYGLMYAVRRACALAKGVLEGSPTDEILVFEVQNNTFVKWMQQERSNDGYEDYFNQVLEELNMLPMRYNFVYNSSVVAARFLDQSNVHNERLTGLEDLLDA